MTKKVITAAAFLAASTMLANAASVLYTFNLETNAVPSNVTANINLHGSGTSGFSQGMDDLKSGAKFTLSSGAYYKMDDDKNPFSSSISTIASNESAKTILTTGTGLQESDISKLVQGVHNGNANATTTFAVTGLDTNTDYTVTLLVAPNMGSSGKISWDGATFTGGSYAYGNVATTTITSSETELTLSSLYAVQLKLTTGNDGSFNIKLYNSSSKTGIGLFAISTNSAIPEPSAFGLLAGLGAIALAVSRRRRRK